MHGHQNFFQDWFIGTVLELSCQLPLSSCQTSMPNVLMTLQELLYSASRAGYARQDHIFHLLFNLVFCHHNAYLWDTFLMLPTPTKHLLCSHQLNSRHFFDDETCLSALETFPCTSNVSLLTQLLSLAQLLLLTVRHAVTPITTGTCLHHAHVSPLGILPKPRGASLNCSPLLSRKKGGGVDLRTSTDLYLTASSFSSSSVLLLPGFSVSAHNDSLVGVQLQLYWHNSPWQHFLTDPWVISVLRDSYHLPFAVNPLPLTLDLPVPSYSCSHPLFQELMSLVQALLAKRAIEQAEFSPGF